VTSFSLQEVGLPQLTYYPSMVVNLQIRLDEGRDVIGDPKTAEDLAASGGRIVPPVEQGPEVLAGGDSDDLSHVLGIVPRSASVELPGYRQAGKFSLELEYRDLPLDPRVIRAVGVAIHLDAVMAGNFAAGMVESRAFGDSGFENGTRRASVADTTVDNIVLSGLADNVHVSHDRSGSRLRLDGRDLRGIMLDLPISQETLKQLDVKKTIDEVVRQIVQDLHPQGAKIEVVVKPSEWPGGRVPAPSKSDDVTRINLNALGDAVRPNAKGEVQKLSFWDLVTSYCFLVGAVPYFVGSKIFVRPARNLFDRRTNEVAFDPNFPTPFKNGKRREVGKPLVNKRERFAFRRLVFGRDIMSYSLERKLAGFKVPVVEATSYDTSGEVRGKDRLIRVQFPPKEEKAATTTNVGPGGKAPATNAVRISVPGVRNKTKLLEIAKDVYEEIGRQEIGGSVETRNLASFGGDNQDPDLLKLRPGDPIEFRVDGSGLGTFPPPIAELTNEEARSREEQVKEVKARVGDEKLARALVAANRGETNDLQKIFRVANVRFDWDHASGLAIAFDFQNFVEARYALESKVDIPKQAPVPAT